MAADGSIIIDTRVNTDGVESGLKNMNGLFNKLIASAGKLGKILASVFAIRQIVAFSKECIALGSDLAEVQNVVDVTFGNMSEQVNSWAKEAAEKFGLSELAAKQYSSTIGAMFKSMGVGGQELTDMSKKVAELAGDMASFYNLDTDTAFNKIRSGIAGITMPLQQLGINLSEANLEQFRISQGMTTAYKNMNQQEKALLRYNYLLSVTSDAQGDFARTSSSWANQTRILSLQLQSLKADLGAGLINVLTPVLQVINKIISGLAKMASAFKAFTNLLTGKKSDTSTTANTGAATAAEDLTDATEAANNYADATDKSTKATQKANKENQKYTSGLDKIHQYQSNTASAASSTPSSAKKGSTPAAASSAVDFGNLSEGETALDKVDKKMQEVVDHIKKAAEPLKKAFGGLLNTLKSAFGWILQNILIPLGKWALNEALPRFFTTLANIITIVDNVLKAAQPGWQWFWDNVLNPIINFVADTFLQFWDFLNEKLAAFAQWCKDNPAIIENATTFILAFFAALTGIKIITGIANMIKSLGTFIAVVKTVIATMNPWTIIIAAVIAAGVLLWKNWDTISAKAKQIWGAISSYLKRTWDTMKRNISSFIDGAKNVWDKGWNAIKTVASNIWNGITGVISGALNRISSIASSVGTNIKNAIVGAFNAIKNAIKKPINGIIGFVNGLVSGVVGGINACIGALNRLKINIPRWVPVYGGKTMGFNIPKLYTPQIPYLASGAVIPPNSPFTAVLGDQKRGNNIEAPESLIRRIVKEETGGGNKKYQFTAMLNRRVLFDETIAEARLRQQMSGMNPFELA